MKRPYETRYWIDQREKAPLARGFPKAEAGSIQGAAKVVAQGFASKVQCIDRSTGEVVWTVKRGDKVRKVNIRPTMVFKGDPDDKPVRRKGERGE